MIEFPSVKTKRSLHTTHYRVTCLNRVLTVAVPAMASPTSLISVQSEGSLVRRSNCLQTSPAWHNSQLVSSLNTFSQISSGRELITTSAGTGSGSEHKTSWSTSGLIFTSSVDAI